MHLYLKKCAVLALCLSGVAQAATWQDLKVGAGGWVRGLTVHSDGTMVARTDTVGAYLYNGSSWVQLVNSSSLPASFINSVDIATFSPNGGTGGGVWEVAIAPLNSSLMYMAFDGYVWKSANKGGTWTQTSYAQDGSMNPTVNGVGEVGQKMAVDPSNNNIVYVGGVASGLRVTTDGGTTWNTVAGVPAGTGAGMVGILFDPASPVVGGATQGIYAFRSGTGLYHSTNGGSTWTQTTGGPTAISYAAITTSGLYYAIDTGADTVQRYNGTTWANLSTGGSGGETFHSLAINPFNQNEIVAGTSGGAINVSYNGGATWTGMIFGAGGGLTSADIPWLAPGNQNSSQGNMSPWYWVTGGGLAFSPSTNGLLFQSAGTGMWRMNVPTNATSSTALIWADFSVGIENLVTKAIVVPPSPGTGLPILVSQDRPFFKITNPNVYQSTYGPVRNQLTQGWSADYASSDPTFIAGLADASVYGQPEQSGYSTDGGATWTRFATNAPGSGSGGTIAASTPQNLIWAPADRVQPSYTMNQGATWTGITLPGVSSWSNFDSAYYFDQRSVTADRVLANTFYLYYGNYGVFKTTNGGAAWTEVHTGAIDPGYFGYNSTIMSVPGNAGHLFYTSGNIGGTTPNSPRAVPFYRSTDGGATWQAVANVIAVTSFGFGAAAPGKTYPAIYIVGFVNNVYGIWQSIDNAVTWTNIGPNGTAYPLGNLNLIDCISGDPNIFGQVYVGTNGGGYAYLSASGAQPIPMAPTNLTVH
jgi:hypothetical protein